MAAAACTFHLVRHAHHGLLGRVLAGRMPGVGLSPAGLDEAAALGRYFAAMPVRAVLASPMLRAKQTAAPIAAAARVAPQTDPAFDEVNFGAWEGQSFEALAQADGWEGWNRARGLAPTPGGETMLAVQVRAMAGLASHGEAGGTVVVVTHADVIKAVLAHALGMPLDLMHRLEVSPASRSTLVLGHDFARVEAFNVPVGDLEPRVRP